MPAVSPFYLQSRKMPFVRLLAALMTGILLQWYLPLSPWVLLLSFVVVAVAYSVFFFLSAYQYFKYQWLRGIAILLLVALCGCGIVYVHHPLHGRQHYTTVYQPGDAIVATVDEALISKPKTWKANVNVQAVYHHQQLVRASGKVIVYFDKTNIAPSLQYGSQILFTKPLQEIKNSGNPGGFDYRRYLLFQGVTAQLYLKRNEYEVLPGLNQSSLQVFLQQTRSYVIQTLQEYIPGKKEQGVAEALLIGYRNDLDKQLVQAYSNTGVVHIIAISGLHLGMIYGFILLLFSPFRNRKWYRFVVPVVAITILWLFALVAGAVPSILRSAVTFTFIAFGMLINRNNHILNTLAASAFCLLVTNPFLLWDVGFQLSYAAVLGIVLFAKPLSRCLYFQNRLLANTWQLSCMNIAAQILTLPIVLYNFHQFPLLFLFNNLLVIPISEVILFATLLLVMVAKWTWLAVVFGKATEALLWLMNTLIEHTEKLPFAVWSSIKLDVVQVVFLYAIIILLAVWLLFRLPRVLLYGLFVLAIFIVYTSFDVWQSNHQQKLVVYSIAKHSAIDLIAQREVWCLSDTALLHDLPANNFSLKPSRTLFRIRHCRYAYTTSHANLLLHANGKTISVISQPLPTFPAGKKLKADVVIISNNPKLYLDDLCQKIDCNTIVADNGTAYWKLRRWQQDCDSLHIRFHSIAQQGAFVMDL